MTEDDLKHAFVVGRALGDLAGDIEAYSDRFSDDEIRESLRILRALEDEVGRENLPGDVNPEEGWRLMHVAAAAIMHVRAAVTSAYRKDFDRIIRGMSDGD